MAKNVGEPGGGPRWRSGGEVFDSMASSPVAIPLESTQDAMAIDAQRYGDPSRPRYATGRRDGKAPAFGHRSPTTAVERD